MSKAVAIFSSLVEYYSSSAPPHHAHCIHDHMADQLASSMQCLFDTLRSTSLQREEIAAQNASNLYTLCIDRITNVDQGKNNRYLPRGWIFINFVASPWTSYIDELLVSSYSL